MGNSGGNRSNFSKSIIGKASDSIVDSESIFILKIKFGCSLCFNTMTLLNNNKMHLKKFNYHIKICKMILKKLWYFTIYDIIRAKSMTYKYHLRTGSESKAKKRNR